MAAGSIVIDLLMKTGSFETDTARAEKRLKKFEQEAVTSARNIGSALGAIGAALSIGAVTQFAREILGGLDALNDFADATGASVENLSALEDIALRTGSSLDTAGSILLKFNSALKDIKPGSGADEVLRRLNLEAEALKRLDPAEALRVTAVAFSKFADDGEKARGIQELFGKSVKDAASFLKDLSEQTRLVGTVTGSATDQAEKFNKELFALNAEATNAARSLAGPFITALNTVAQSFRDSEAAGESFYTKITKGQLAVLDNPFGLGLPKNTGGASGSFGDPVRPSLGGFTGPEIPGDILAGRNRPKGGGAPRQSEADRYIESLQRQLDLTKDFTVVEQVLSDLQRGRLGKVNAAQKDALLGVAGQIDAARRLESQFKAEENQLRDLRDAQEAIRGAGAAIYDATRNPLEKLNIEQDRLNLLLKEGAINWETFNRAIQGAQDAYEQTVEPIKKVGEEIDEFSKNAARSIQDSIGDGLVDAMNGNFKNIGDSFTKLLQRLVAESLATDITRALFGKAGGGDGSGFLGTALSAAGSFFGFGGAKAGGGDVMSGRSYLVGEQGPEMFVPRTAGLIMNAAQTAGGTGRSINVNNSFTINGPTDRRSQEQIASNIARKLSAVSARGNA